MELFRWRTLCLGCCVYGQMQQLETGSRFWHRGRRKMCRRKRQWPILLLHLRSPGYVHNQAVKLISAPRKGTLTILFEAIVPFEITVLLN